MIWRWRTSFSPLAQAAFIGSLLSQTVATQGVSGSVVLRDSRVDAVVKRSNYSGVVISLVPVEKQAQQFNPRHFRMLQKDKMFTPHVLPISVGSTVDFPNADPIFHNAFSSYSGQIFDVGLYPPGSNRSVRFTKAGVVRVFCNIHPAMSAVILVLDTPYFATTAPDGSFHIDAPPGDYQLNVFHERSPETTLHALTHRVTVGPGRLQLSTIEISESGYLVAPHKNKYGNEYPPGSGTDSLYPGAKK
jgi:plastocyanin